MVDSKWAIFKWREWLNSVKDEIAEITNQACIYDIASKSCIRWWLSEAMKSTDVFIWVSAPWVLTSDMVKSMNTDPINFAMANPTQK